MHFQRVLGADKPPNLIQPQFAIGLKTHVNMAGVRRVKGPSNQANFQLCPAVKQMRAIMPSVVSYELGHRRVQHI